ncbi:hypothetical protein NMG60_11001257 [Bertholletia excelsa]
MRTINNNDKENTLQLGSFFMDCGDGWPLYVHYPLHEEVWMNPCEGAFLKGNRHKNPNPLHHKEANLHVYCSI